MVDPLLSAATPDCKMLKQLQKNEEEESQTVRLDEE